MGSSDEMSYDFEALLEHGVAQRCPRYREGPVDLEGKPVKRTKQAFPYSYDAHVITRRRRNARSMECAYVDRMWGWDRPKMKRLTKKYLGMGGWPRCPGPQVEALLREWDDDPGLQLVAVMEWCDRGTGWATWSLHWVPSKEKLEERAEKARVQARAQGCAKWDCEKQFADDQEVVLDESRGYPDYFCQGCEPKEVTVSKEAAPESQEQDKP